MRKSDRSWPKLGDSLIFAGHAGRLAVAVALLSSALPHIGNSHRFLNDVLNYDLVPWYAAVTVAAVLPYLQLVLGVALLFAPGFRRAAFALCVVLFGVFVAAQASAAARGLDISCGCFQGSGQRVGSVSIGLAGGCLLLSAAGLLTARRPTATTQDAPEAGGHRRHGPTEVAGAARTPRLGVTLVEVLVVVATMAALFGLVLAGVQRVRAAAARAECGNRLRQLGLALHAYHDLHRHLPDGVSYQGGASPQPHMTWMTRLLPHLEQESVWRQAEAAFREDRFFERPPHRPVLSRRAKEFICPADPAAQTPHAFVTFTVGLATYLGVEGTSLSARDGVLFLDSGLALTAVTDGTSQTLAVGERPPSPDARFGWWYAGWGQEKTGSADSVLGVRELIVDPYLSSVCRDAPYPYRPGKVDNDCDTFHFWSHHPGGANFAFCDGSVRFLRYEADAILPALATRAGGEVVTIPD